MVVITERLDVWFPSRIRVKPYNVLCRDVSALVLLKMNMSEVFLVCFLFPSSPCPNVHSSFIRGPESSSSQMSSPVAKWEGKHRVGGWGWGGRRGEREMCIRTGCV